MLNILLGIGIGIMLALIIVKIQNYLIKNHLMIRWNNILIAIFILTITGWLIYSFIGMTIGPEYTKTNGNVCKGYKYGMQICHGDINAE